MSVRVEVKPEMLGWARERSRRPAEDLAARFPKLPEWEAGEKLPTLKQLEDYANATHAPIGWFFLGEPPVEHLPIPDFRTMGGEAVAQPSPDLLETIYICQQRQEWYRDFARQTREDPLAFVGSLSIDAKIPNAAASLRQALGFDLDERAAIPTWTDALRRFVEQADALGVLVMTNGVVGNNTHRKLDPREFRGFALADDFAPVVFVNGADTKSAQMFTLAHELAHLWLGASALSNATMREPPLEAEMAANVGPPQRAIETWCNRVAAELLVPLEAFGAAIQPGEPLADALKRLARQFKVSTLVILRRLHDAGAMSRAAMWQAYDEELQHLAEVPRGSGGNFYATEFSRLGKRMTRALIASTLEGQTLYRDAFQLLSISKVATFNEMAHRLGYV